MESRVPGPDGSVRMWRLKTDRRAVVLWAVLICLALTVNISE